VPNGEEWQHEIKFDGFIQIHKLGNEVELYSRNGSRFSRRFPRLVGVSCRLAGMPDVWRLFLRSAKPAELHFWGFDLPGDERQGSGQVVAGSPPGTPASPHEPV
jgi:ATP-dependent DNA ligase